MNSKLVVYKDKKIPRGKYPIGKYNANMKYPFFC
jgi:hypothetical protein